MLRMPRFSCGVPSRTVCRSVPLRKVPAMTNPNVTDMSAVGVWTDVQKPGKGHAKDSQNANR